MSKEYIEELEKIIVAVARAESDSRMSGPDGDKYGFCSPDYPETPGSFGDNELDAAIGFLKERYL